MRFLLTAVLTASFALSSLVGAEAARYRRPMGYNGQWVSTQTLGLEFNQATDLGPVPPGTTMHVSVGLAMPNMSGAEAAAKALYTKGSPTYHHFLTPAQFTNTWGPSAATASAVASYLQSAGLSSVTIEPNRMLVTATGNAAAVEQAFNTSLHSFKGNGTAWYANVSVAQVPAAFGSSVIGVLGLNNVVMNQTAIHKSPRRIQAHVRKHPSRGAGIIRRSHKFANAATLCNGISVNGICELNTYSLNALRLAYDDQNSATGANANIAVFTGGALGTVVNDLRLMEADQGYAQVPVNVVHLGSSQSTDTSGDDEWDLDTQSSSGMAGGVNSLTIYNVAELDDWDATEMYNRFVTDDTVQEASASYGECEAFPYVDGEMRIDDQIFFEATFQGQSMFASTGDTGSSCPAPFVPISPNGTPVGLQGSVNYPAASPFVVAAGGTSLLTNSSDGSYYGETTWSFGGGGMSAFEVSTLYQTTTLQEYANRTIPDVAMDADDLQSPVDIVVAGTYEAIGGTSVSSPVAMGVFSRFESAFGNQLGSALPTFYTEYSNWGGDSVPPPAPQPGQITTQIGGFHDILLGNNGLYDALPGYDLTTGLGSLDINNFLIGLGQG